MPKKKVDNPLPLIIDPPPFVVDPRLGRRPQKDPRSAAFPISGLLPRTAYAKPRTKVWACGPVLDQLNEGSCVGHAYAHQLAAFPYPLKGVNHTSAVGIYKKAQTIDEWPGTAYEGTSVLAGVKAAQALYPNAIESYRWATVILDVIATLSWFGPVILGCDWYSDFYTPDSTGRIKLAGDIVGGHAILVRGVDVEKNLILIRNSWGVSYGKKGNAWISIEDFDKLLRDGGDCCVPVPRKYWT